MPMKVQASRSRLDLTPAFEGDVPAYFLWDDGSEYEVWGVAEPGYTRPTHRRYRGPLFGCKDWKTETIG